MNGLSTEQRRCLRAARAAQGKRVAERKRQLPQDPEERLARLENYETSQKASIKQEQFASKNDVNYQLRESRTGDYRGVVDRFLLRSSRVSRDAALPGGRPRSRPRARSPRGSKTTGSRADLRRRLRLKPG
jgi:hypothetical protein